MSDQISFNGYTLGEWFLGNHSEEEVENLFVSMDKALKSLHEKGSCVNNFYPTDISIGKVDIKNISFNSVVELSSDSTEKEKMIFEDITKQGIIHFSYYYYQTDNSLGYYDLLNYIVHYRDSFLFSGFSNFSSLFPLSDVDYYKQIFKEQKPIYYSDYKSDLKMKNNSDGAGKSNSYVKKTDNQLGVGSIVSEYDNEGGLSLNNNDAFVRLFLIPVIISIVIIVLILFRLMFTF